MREEEETEIHDEEDELFGEFKFRSFKTHKQMEEEYNILDLEDPEEPIELETIQLFPAERVGKEQLEIVPVTKA